MTKLQLDPGILDYTRSAPPLTAQLADHLRQLIASRDLAPGDVLPGEHKIAMDTGLSRTSVRNALKALDDEGLIERRAGAATRVATAAPVRRMHVARYRRQVMLLKAGEGAETAFVTDHGATFDRFSVMPCEVTKETATAQDMHYLDVRKGSKILRRRMVKRIDGVPLEIQRSAMPFSLVRRIPPVDQATHAPGGTLAWLWSLDIRPDYFTEEFSARMPNRIERDLLQMTTNGPVWDTVRRFIRDNQPVEVSRVIAPCARNTIYVEGEL